MIHLIKSELYQLTHRKAPILWIVVGMVMGLAIPVLHGFGAEVNTSSTLEAGLIINILSQLIPSVAPFLLLGIAGVTFNNELKNRTLVNAVSYGIPRWQLYVVKLLGTISWGVLFVTATLMTLSIGYAVLFKVPFTELFFGFISYLIVPLMPVWIAFAALYVTSFFFSETPAASFAMFAVVFMVVPLGLQLLSLYYDWAGEIYARWLTVLNPVNQPMGEFLSVPIASWIALGYTTFFVTLGLVHLNHKEIH